MTNVRYFLVLQGLNELGQLMWGSLRAVSRRRKGPAGGGLRKGEAVLTSV